MSDGKRTMKVSLTEAQYDVLQAALASAFSEWHYTERARDRQTLLRANTQLHLAWEQGIRA
ncbi:MAG: hypothetical protein EBR30_21280 [Cytophagia bacterium]|nr:hypothetical protein [Cytophagia bacterium]NBW37499.1 hypothetical protein [Cytophagia bacterium]